MLEKPFLVFHQSRNILRLAKMQQMGVFQAQVFRSHGQNLTDKLERNLQLIQNDTLPPEN